MSSLNFQNLSTVQSEQQPDPPTVAAASVLPAITSFLTFVTGTTQVASIPAPTVGGLLLIALVFTNANPGAFTGAGNIASTKDPAQNELVLLCWNPINSTWYVVN